MMKKIFQISCFSLLFSSVFPAFAAEQTAPPAQTVQAKTPEILGEKVGFMSADPLLFGQLLDTEKVQPQPVWGFLSLPSEADSQTKKFPAVIFMSGSTGVQTWTNKYVKKLNSLGIATFTVDSFTPRGKVQSVTDQSDLPVPMMIQDAYSAFKYLDKQPNIDSKRIMVMGWSLGGLVSLTTAFEDLNIAQLGENGPRFAGHIAFYPACNLDYPNNQLDGAPWLYLHGDKDDYTQISDCLSLISQVRDSAVIKAVLYPNAYHAFDSDDKVEWLADAQNPKNCRGKLDADWNATEEKTGIALDSQENYQKAYAGCMLKGAHVGYNARASEDAMYEVSSFAQHYLLTTNKK